MNKAVDEARERLRPIFIGATALLVLLLVFFAWSLARSQAQQREDLQKRFSDRAEVAAGVNQAIFTLSEAQTATENARLFGGDAPSRRALERRAAQSQQAYGQILDAQGRVLAATKAAPDRAGRPSNHVRDALRSGRTRYSEVLEGPAGRAVVETASPFKAGGGQRVHIGAISADLLASFLNSFLGKLPNVEDARSYVIDAGGQLVAAPGTKAKPGAKLADQPLLEALGRRRSGSYGDGRYFTSSAMPPTPWRIVLSAADSRLFATVDGSERIVPWIIFGAFVLAAGLGLFLLRRVLLANTQLERAELSRQHALEINDNVVQRLVVAKYALDRGATDMSHQKLSETLRETQQLVTSLLEEKDIAPGALRRGEAAGTEGPPAPPGGGGT